MIKITRTTDSHLYDAVKAYAKARLAEAAKKDAAAVIKDNLPERGEQFEIAGCKVKWGFDSEKPKEVVNMDLLRRIFPDAFEACVSTETKTTSGRLTVT